ncbi:hypothetical protein ACFQY7_28030 [Actinomadura luteofluorescens]|uniref:hypothetical protein n=1 Tax=Actinomadura luteofluorescens TaxID=46163 RepID=UPI00363881AB
MLNLDGWNAIDGVLKEHYGDAARLEWDAPVPYRRRGRCRWGGSSPTRSRSTRGTSPCRTGISWGTR